MAPTRSVSSCPSTVDVAEPQTIGNISLGASEQPLSSPDHEQRLAKWRGASGAKYPRHGFSSWTVTEARVCSQSRRISQVLPFRTKEIVKFSSVDGSFDVVTGTRTMSEASPSGLKAQD